MPMIEYGLQKMIWFFVVALIPVLTGMVLLAVGFPLLGALFFPMVLGFVIAYIGNTYTSQNPFVKAVEGQGLLAFDFNSSGLANVFTVQVNVPNIELNTKEGKESRFYDRMISLVLREPRDANMDEKQDDFQQKYLEFRMPIEEYQKSVFKHKHLNFMIFNSQTGMFLTKEFLANMEKTLMVEYVTLNEWRELKEMNKVMRDFTRTTMDTVLHKMSGQLLSNPIVKIIAIVLVAIILIFLVISAASLVGIDLIPSGGLNLFQGAPATAASGAARTPIDDSGRLIIGLARLF